MKQTMSAFQLKHIDILHFFVTTQSTKRGHGAVGSAFEWHSKGQGFESPWLHHILPIRTTGGLVFYFLGIFFSKYQ